MGEIEGFVVVGTRVLMKRQCVRNFSAARTDRMPPLLPLRFNGGRNFPEPARPSTGPRRESRLAAKHTLRSMSSRRGISIELFIQCAAKMQEKPCSLCMVGYQLSFRRALFCPERPKEQMLGMASLCPDQSGESMIAFASCS